MTGSTPGDYLYDRLERYLKIKRNEIGPVVWSFLYFFFLLSGYYVLRPIRDVMGIQGGIDNLPWMFSGTFIATAAVVPVFGWIASTFSKRRIVPAFYSLFIVTIVLFYGLMRGNIYPQWVAIAFFIWLSVFNLFVVSVFWSFMVDVYHPDQSERLFGFIAAGGTTGAILGPTLTATLPSLIGTKNMLLVSAFLLLGTLICIQRILFVHSTLRSGVENDVDEPSHDRDDVLDPESTIGGNFLDGITKFLKTPYLMGIGLFIVLYSATSTIVYFEQAEIIKQAVSTSANRTQIFALIDFLTNTLTILVQLFVTGSLIDYFGPGPSLVSLPTITVAGFMALALSPVLLSLIVFQVLRRSSNYALAKPSREILFSPLSDSEKYKGKNVVDTLVYRGGDAATGWLYASLQYLGYSLTGIALIGSGLALGWIVLSLLLIVAYRHRT